MRTTLILSAALLAMVALGATGARAQFNTTGAEREACRSDAIRLCLTHVGSLNDMRTCMIANKSKLSNACRRVVDGRA